MLAGKQRLIGILTQLRAELIRQAVIKLSDLSPDEYHALTLEAPAAYVLNIRKSLAQTFIDGRQRVASELAIQQRQAKSEDQPISQMIPPDETEEIGRAARIVAGRTANEVQARAVQIATQRALTNATEIIDTADALETAIDETTSGYVSKIATEASNVTFAQGRAYEYEVRQEEVSRVIYSAILDGNTCQPCSSADGQEGATPDDLTDVPNPDCEGGLMCRCLHVFVLNTEETTEPKLSESAPVESDTE